jgi:hypothetical protein
MKTVKAMRLKAEVGAYLDQLPELTPLETMSWVEQMHMAFGISEVNSEINKQVAQ